MNDKSRCRFCKGDCCTYYGMECCEVSASKCLLAYSPRGEILDLSFGNSSVSRAGKNNGVLPDNAYLESIPCYEIDSDDMVDLYVYGGYLHSHCHDCTLNISDFHRTTRYKIFVSKSDSNKFYIAKEVLQVYMNRRYTLAAHMHYASYAECSDPIIRGELAVASPLKLYGYAVGKHGASENRRHEIINYILDNGIMRVNDIINLLQFNIVSSQSASQNKEKAIAEWRQDIEWLIDYC